MDSVLEKLTLYDLVGYTIPGILLVLYAGRLFMADGCDIDVKDYALYAALLVLMLGYCAGVAISGVACILDKAWRSFWKCKFLRGTWIKGQYDRHNNVGYENIGYSLIEKTLREKGVIRGDEEIKIENNMGKYEGYIYGEVQVMPEYKRLHNYASMQTFCQNMEVVSLLFLLAGFLTGSMDMTRAITALIMALVFAVEKKMFYNRKMFYAAVWFIRKENNSASHLVERRD